MSATHNTKVSGIAKADWRIDPDNRQNRRSGQVTVRKATPEELEKYKDIKPYKKPSMIDIPVGKRKDCVDMQKDNEVIKGVGKDAEKVVNEAGGRQSKLDYRFDLMDSGAMFELAAVLSHGAEEYGIDNWRKIPSRDHINHAITHLYAHLAGDTQDEHLSHAFCRLMMAIGTKE